jgi:DTW domain-containing protein YfiP
VAVVLHHKEQNKPTNTGHLARLVLPEAELRNASVSGDVGPPLDADPDRRAVLLFPRPDARILTVELRDEDPRPLTLVVPDAAWRQARRMANRWPALRQLPAVALPEGSAPKAALRKRRRLGPSAHGTLDAIARALGILESQYVEDGLRAVLDRAVLHGLYARGRAPADAPLKAQLRAARASGLDVP